MKKLTFILMAAAALFTACNKEETQATGALKADFKMSANTCQEGEEVTFEASAEGGRTPYTFNWEIAAAEGEKISFTGQSKTQKFESCAPYVVKLTVVDKDGKKVEKRKNLVVTPAPIPETGELSLVWAAKLPGYNAFSSPAVADDGSVYATTQSAVLYKFDANGNEVWNKTLGDKCKATPSIDEDGTVYIGTGTTNGKAAVYAFAADGSEKWKFAGADKFWAPDPSKLSPSVQAAICGIGSENIYFGNTGTAGTVIAVNKQTGARVAWHEVNGGGPAGGCRAGIVVTKSGNLIWGAGRYGVFGSSKNTVDAANNSGVAWAWRTFTDWEWTSPDTEDDGASNNNEGAIGMATIGGKSCVVGIMSDPTSPKIYAVDVVTGAVVSSYRVLDSPTMDNGSVAVTAEGYVVATLNFSNGYKNGGIVVVDLSAAEGRKVAEFRIADKVSCTPAVDAAGNIHFASEGGDYYVVDKNCNLLVKKSLKSLVEANATELAKFGKPFDAAKVWCSPVIGDNGKIYIQFTNNDSEKKREYGALVCLQTDACTGPGNTSWPMIGQNRRHTNCEK